MSLLLRDRKETVRELPGTLESSKNGLVLWLFHSSSVVTDATSNTICTSIKPLRTVKKDYRFTFKNLARKPDIGSFRYLQSFSRSLLDFFFSFPHYSSQSRTPGEQDARLPVIQTIHYGRACPWFHGLGQRGWLGYL